MFCPPFLFQLWKRVGNLKCTQETMAFVQTSAKWLNFTNCAGTQTLIRLYYQSYLERRSWREKKSCACEGVSCSLFGGRNFSASVEWCGEKINLKYACICTLTVLWPRPAQTLAWFGIVTCCTLFCRAVLAGFSQCHLCGQRGRTLHLLPIIHTPCLLYEGKNQLQPPCKLQCELRVPPFQEALGSATGCKDAVNSMAVSRDGYWENTGTSLLLLFTEQHAGHPFSMLQKN